MKSLVTFLVLMSIPICIQAQCNYSYGEWDTQQPLMDSARTFFSAVSCTGYDQELISASIENTILTLNWLSQEGESTDPAVNAICEGDTISSNSFSISSPLAIRPLKTLEMKIHPGCIML